MFYFIFMFLFFKINSKLILQLYLKTTILIQTIFSFFSDELLIRVCQTSCFTCSPANVTYLLTCSRANLPGVLTCWRAYVLTCSLTNLSCVFSLSRANVAYVITCSRSKVPCIATCSRAILQIAKLSFQWRVLLRFLVLFLFPVK